MTESSILTEINYVGLGATSNKTDENWFLECKHYQFSAGRFELTGMEETC